MKRNKLFVMLLAFVMTASMMLTGLTSVFADASPAAEDSMVSDARLLSSGRLMENRFHAMKCDGTSGVAAYVSAGSTSFLKEGTENGAAIDHGNVSGVQNTWFRIKPSRTGVMIIRQGASGHIRLYDSRKRALSDDIYVNGGSTVGYMRYTVFGVKANATYYVRISSAGVYSSGSGVYMNAVKYESRAVPGSYGKSASRASRLARNKVRKGYILSKGSPKYYRFTKKGKNVKIYLDSMTDKRIQVTVTARAKGCRTYNRTISLYNSDNADDTGKRLTLTTDKSRTIHVTIRVKGYGNSSGVYSVKCV